MVQRLAGRLDIPPKALVSYGDRDQTRTDHLVEVAKLLDWRAAGDVEFKELDQFPAGRALEHDSPTLLFRLACDYPARPGSYAPVPSGCPDGWPRPGRSADPSRESAAGTGVPGVGLASVGRTLTRSGQV